jgi:hypothetical protein
MLPVLTFSIILIAAVVSIVLTAYCHAAVSSLHDSAEDHNTIPCTKDPIIEQIAKNEVLKESVNNQQMLIFPNQPLGELKVERG